MAELKEEKVIEVGTYNFAAVTAGVEGNTTNGTYTPPTNSSTGTNSSSSTNTGSGGTYIPPENTGTGSNSSTSTNDGTHTDPNDTNAGSNSSTSTEDGVYDGANENQTPGSTNWSSTCDSEGLTDRDDVPVRYTPTIDVAGTKVADPVDAYSGAHTIKNNILSLFGGQNISLIAHYNSSKLTKGSLGVGWYHNFEKHIGFSGTTILVYETPAMFSEYEYYANKITGAEFRCNDVDKRGYVLIGLNNSPYQFCLNCNHERYEYFNSQGQLVKIVSKQGFETLISYTDNLVTITDTVTNRSIYLEKNETGKVTRVYDDAGRSTVIGYKNNYLKCILDPNGNSLTYYYDSDGRIKSATDSNNICYFQNIYDEYGRVVAQYDAESLIPTRFEYSTDVRVIRNRNTHSSIREFSGGLLTKFTDENGNTIAYEYDNDGHIIKETDKRGNFVTKEYHETLHKPIKITDKNGYVTNYEYDDNGNVKSITYPNGSIETFEYNGRNQIEKHTDLRGVVTVYEYDTINNLPKSKKVGSKSAHTYTYSNGFLMSERDPLGNETKYEYNMLGLVSKKTDPLNNSTLYEYDLTGNITKITDANGNTIEYTYDANYQKVSSKDANGNVTQYTYNGNLKPVKTTYADGSFDENVYDGEDKVIKIIGRNGQESNVTYDKGGRPTLKTLPDGSNTSYIYDGVGNIRRETNHYGAIVNKTYDAIGNILTSTIKMSENDNGATTVYTYDNMSRLVSKALPNGAITTYTYNAAGDLLSESTILNDNTNIVKSYEYDAYGNKIKFTDPNGNITRYTYDDNNNLKMVVDALNNETVYEYDKKNQLIKVTDAKGYSIQHEYDKLGRKTKTIDAKGNCSTTTYDANGNVLSVTDKSGIITYLYTYNCMNQVVSVTDACSNTTTYDYTDHGKLATVTNSLNNTHTYGYDAKGRNILVTEPTNASSSASYNHLDKVTCLTGPLGTKTEYEYDSLGRLTEESVAGGTRKHTYNAAGLKETFTNARSKTRIFSYDKLGRVTGYVTEDGETAIFTYDSNGNVLTATDSKGTVTRKFDALNRVTEYTDTLGKTIKYEYDEVGNLIKLTYPDNTSVNYAYDCNHNLVGVTDWAGRVTMYIYDANDRVTSVNRLFSCSTANTYDNAGRIISTVTSKGDNVVSGFEYVYDQLGRITSETNLAKNIKLCYTYDTLSRVLSKTVISLNDNTIDPIAETFNYTPSGNMTIGLGENIMYDAHNRLVVLNTASFIYDSDGNILESNAHELTFDFANRLISANGYTYTYDVENIRVKKAYGDTDTTYTHNANSKLSQLLMKTENGVTTKYVYGLGLIYEETTNDIKVYHYDYRGSTVALTDSTGEVTDTFEYDTYGSMTARTGTTVTPFLYNGRDGVMSDENGLVYMRARYYSPVLKRFINADVIAGSITNSITLNRYAYANGNPVSNIDPFGLSAERGGGSGKKHLPIAFGVESAYDGFTFDNILEYSSLICLNQGPISINSTYIKDYSNLPYSVLMMFSGRKIHELIEKDIITNYGEDMKSEVAITRNDGKPGRADLLNKEGELWEIKKNNHAQILLGYRQIRKYNGGYFKVDEEIKSISLGGYLPSGCVNYGGTNVDYFYFDNGLILYNYPSKRNEAKKDEGVESSAEIPIAIAVYGALGYALAHAGYSNLTTNNNYGNMVYFSNVNGPEFEHMYDYYDNEDEAA